MVSDFYFFFFFLGVCHKKKNLLKFVAIVVCTVGKVGKIYIPMKKYILFEDVDVYEMLCSFFKYLDLFWWSN